MPTTRRAPRPVQTADPQSVVVDMSYQLARLARFRRARQSITRSGMARSEATCTAPPRAIASFGMPNTTHDSSASAMVSAPACAQRDHPVGAVGAHAGQQHGDDRQAAQRAPPTWNSASTAGRW